MVTREHTCLVCEIGSSLFGKSQVSKAKVGRPLQNINTNSNIIPTPIKLVFGYVSTARAIFWPLEGKKNGPIRMKMKRGLSELEFRKM